MKRKPLLPLVFLCFFLITAPVNTSGQLRAGNADVLSVVLIIDSSGSMVNNDPNNDRIAAAQKVVELLRENDEISVVHFSDRPTVLVPLKKIGTSESRAEISTLLSGIGARGDTDIKGGLENGYAELNKATGGKRFALLLSDGEPDLPHLRNNPRAKEAYLNDIKNTSLAYKTKGWAVHCIALHQKEAGPVLRRIAEQTGGEYFFVPEASTLVKFFQSILVVQKHHPEERPKLASAYETQPYKTGQRFPVRAWLKLREDLLVPGPHLKVDKIQLVLSTGEKHLETLTLRDDGMAESADDRASDGIFSCRVKCRKQGQVTLTLTMEGMYRGEKISDKAVIGQIQVLPGSSAGRRVANLAQRAAIPAAVLVVVSALLILAARFIKNRLVVSVKGTLRYWAESQDNPAIQELELTRLKKSEVVVATERKEGVDFILPVLTNHFTFKIKKLSKAQQNIEDGKELSVAKKGAYIAAGLPGTFLVFEEEPGVFENKPRTRKEVHHGDRFRVRGYIFEFNCPEAGTALKDHQTISKLPGNISKMKN